MTYKTPNTQPSALPGQELAQLLGGGRGDGDQYWVPAGTGAVVFEASAVSGAQRAVYRRTDRTLPTAWGTAVIYLLDEIIDVSETLEEHISELDDAGASSRDAWQ